MRAVERPDWPHPAIRANLQSRATEYSSGGVSGLPGEHRSECLRVDTNILAIRRPEGAVASMMRRLIAMVRSLMERAVVAERRHPLQRLQFHQQLLSELKQAAMGAKSGEA